MYGGMFMLRRIMMLSVLTAITVVIFGLVGCSKISTAHQSASQESIIERASLSATETNSLQKMTTEDVIRIKKQGLFSWSDFSTYEGEDIGSGLFVFQYKIVDGGYLLVSGPSLDQEP